MIVKTTRYHYHFLFECLFHVRPSDFMQSIQDQTCHRCINHDILVSLCSKMLMKLSYFIHLGFGESFCLLWESNLGLLSDCVSLTLPLYQSTNSFIFLVIIIIILVVITIQTEKEQEIR